MEEKRFLKKYDHLKLGWLHDSIKFIVLIVVLFVMFRYVIGLSYVSGNSMNPTLFNRQGVVYSRIVPEYRQGDVVSVRVPSGDYYIKRVIAVGGDVVDVYDGKVFVNGEELDEPYIQGVTEEENGAVIYPYVVREGNLFVLGDNRTVSMDSRAFGEVNLRQVRGRVVLYFGRWYVNRI